MIMQTTELLMIRHGQSEANVGIACAPDCALTEAGLGQARDAARLFQARLGERAVGRARDPHVRLALAVPDHQ